MEKTSNINGAQCTNTVKLKRAPNLDKSKIIETPSRGVVHIPRNLDLDQLLYKYPLKVNANSNSFEKVRDSLAAILSQILYKELYYKDYNNNGEFKNLSSETLERLSRDYKLYLNWAAKTGIIECDNEYTPKVKSLGYRFIFPYSDSYFKRHYIYNYPVLQRKLKSIGISQETVDKFPTLYQYLEDVEFNYDKAVKLISDITYSQQKEKKWTDEKTEQKLYGRLAAVEKFDRREFIFKQDSKVGRLHTNLTNMKKEVRSCLRWNGEKLVNIDIKNSQPFFSLGIFEKNTWDRLDIGNMVRRHSRYYERSELDSDTLYYMFLENTEKMRTYSVLVQGGLLYDTLVGHGFGKNGVIKDRDMSKEVIFEVLFSPQIFLTKKQRLFKSMFPAVFEAFSVINRGYHKIKGAKHNSLKRKPGEQSSTLALLLQEIEAKVMLEYVVPALILRFPGLPIFTIHDSIMTLESHQDEVKQLMEEVIEEVTGYKPMLEIE